MLNAPSLTPRNNELVRREIQEIRDAVEAFKAAIEAGELTGFKDGGMPRWNAGLALICASRRFQIPPHRCSRRLLSRACRSTAQELSSNPTPRRLARDANANDGPKSPRLNDVLMGLPTSGRIRPRSLKSRRLLAAADSK
jgi:hypothetical protein